MTKVECAKWSLLAYLLTLPTLTAGCGRPRPANLGAVCSDTEGCQTGLECVDGIDSAGATCQLL